MTQQRLSELSGISREAINKYCRGRIGLGERNAVKIARALDVDVDVLVPRAPEPLDPRDVERRLARLERIVQGRPDERASPEHPLDVLVDYINENILGDTQLTTLDMLEALASTGTRVEADPGGQSALDYYRRA